MRETFDPVTDTRRELRDADGGSSSLLIRRQCDAAPDDVWDALTDPERLVRWFLPISGDLRVGGRYSLEGNASGEIKRCDRSREIEATWEYARASSDVVVRLTPDGERTAVELEHFPVSAGIIPNASPEVWGLGAGSEMGTTALGDGLAGKLPDGRAVDWISTASMEDRMAAGALVQRISDAWTAVIGARD